MTYYISNWITKDGYMPATGLLIALTVGIALVGMLILMKWGKALRIWTANSKIHGY